MSRPDARGHKVHAELVLPPFVFLKRSLEQWRRLAGSHVLHLAFHHSFHPTLALMSRRFMHMRLMVHRLYQLILST